MTMQQSPDKDDFAAEPRSIDLRDYWLVVRRRWLLILVLTGLGAVLAGGYAQTLTPTYSATAQVLVSGITGGPGVPASQVNVPVNMSTEQSVAQGTGVIDAAAQILKVQQPVLQAEAAKNLTVTVPATTLTTSDVLLIAWKAGSPQAAQAGADAFATAFLAGWHKGLVAQVASLQASLSRNVASLAKQIGQVSAQLSNTLPTSSAHTSLQISLTELTGLQSTASSQLEQINTYNTSGGSVIQAAPPATPSGISRSVIIVVGALLGLIVGLVLAFLWNTFDDRVHEPAQFERALGAPVLAVLPLAKIRSGHGKDKSQPRPQPIATVTDPSGRSAEAVRVLRAALVTVAARKKLRTVLVVAADPSVATGRVVGELGVALAESGRRVLLVGADMRGSVLPYIFDLPNKVGLSDLLTGGGDPEVLIHQPKQVGGVPLPDDVVQKLRVLSPGREIAHALSVIDSDAMLSLLQSQRESYEFVVLDSPPANIAADAIALAGHVDGVLMIASRRVKGRAINDLRRRLDQVDALVIGGAFVIKAKAGHRRRPAVPQAVTGPSTASLEPLFEDEDPDQTLLLRLETRQESADVTAVSSDTPDA
jgi:capsular polysaccharide biosynthesis protein/Mrp family chromosome partitioning ATPase